MKYEWTKKNNRRFKFTYRMGSFKSKKEKMERQLKSDKYSIRIRKNKNIGKYSFCALEINMKSS